MKALSTSKRSPIAKATQATKGAGVKGEEQTGFPRPLGITRN